MKFTPPFHVKDHIIYDEKEIPVKLWGVNYYAPFNNNFYNIQELGLDHRAIIDRDLEHLKLMGVDLIRMHLYEREITDRYGNTVENKNLHILDYLLAKCEELDIFVMMCPIAWWNTVKNQIQMDEYYAYWYVDSQEDFGFTNFYSCDSMLWDPEAIDCTERYYRSLFSRKSSVNGKTMPEYRNIILMELMNEPRYPQMWQLEQSGSGIPPWSRTRQYEYFLSLWEKYLKTNPEAENKEARFEAFKITLLDFYFKRLWPIIEEYFGHRVLKGQFSSYHGGFSPEIADFFEKSAIDVITIGTYLNVQGFEANSTDHANHLELASQWFRNYDHKAYGMLPRVAYEFDASATTHGYPFAAIAAEYAKRNIQLATMFTYTPSGIAPWNPGWLVHYFNLEHTPAKAAAFAAAGEIFRNTPAKAEIDKHPEEWSGPHYSIRREHDSVIYSDGSVFNYSADNNESVNVSTLESIIGRGKSSVAESSGNGVYFLQKKAEKEWSLILFPNQRYLLEPTRGRAFRVMANRYINCCKEPPVSQLIDEAVRFQFHAFEIQSCHDDAGNEIPVKEHALFLKPGRYHIQII